MNMIGIIPVTFAVAAMLLLVKAEAANSRDYASMNGCSHRASLHQVLGAVYQAVNSVMMII